MKTRASIYILLSIIPPDGCGWGEHRGGSGAKDVSALGCCASLLGPVGISRRIWVSHVWQRRERAGGSGADPESERITEADGVDVRGLRRGTVENIRGANTLRSSLPLSLSLSLSPFMFLSSAQLSEDRRQIQQNPMHLQACAGQGILLKWMRIRRNRRQIFHQPDLIASCVYMYTHTCRFQNKRMKAVRIKLMDYVFLEDDTSAQARLTDGTVWNLKMWWGETFHIWLMPWINNSCSQYSVRIIRALQSIMLSHELMQHNVE